jgi:hypothetical protein
MRQKSAEPAVPDKVSFRRSKADDHQLDPPNQLRHQLSLVP